MHANSCAPTPAQNPTSHGTARSPDRASTRSPRGGGDRFPNVRPERLLAALLVTVFASACGGEPPEGLGGFRIGMSQSEAMDTAYAREGFTCRLLASVPKQTLCSGPTDQGSVEALVRGDTTVRVTLEVARTADDPVAATRRFARPFGDPAWRDRPYPPTAEPPEGYHTLWVNEDSTRSIAMICRGPELGPPCNARLATTTPAGVEARLDSLLGIRR